MRLPALLALAALALLCAACSSGGGKDERTAAIIHRLLMAGGSGDASALQSFPGELPEGLPFEPPLYPGADLIVSVRQPSASAASATPGAPAPGQPLPQLYFIVLDTGDDRSDVFTFYEDALDTDPWQIENTTSTEDLDVLEFFKVDDPDIIGAVSIARGGDDGRTGILISFDDAGAIAVQVPPFELGESLPVPKEFPTDVPVYQDATVTGSVFVRQPALQQFLLIFLTTDAQDDVIAFYRQAFQDNGWTVTDSAPIALETRIEFLDPAGDIQGSVEANRFEEDRAYTRVQMEVYLNPAREPGAAATPAPSATPAD